MKITTIHYSRTYGLPNFGSEKIGFEASIDNEGEVDHTLQLLKNQCDTIHKKNNPHLYQEQTPIVPEYLNNITGRAENNVLIVEPKQEPELSEYDQMKLCPNQQDLDNQWKLLSMSDKKTKTYYDLRTLELKNTNL